MDGRAGKVRSLRRGTEVNGIDRIRMVDGFNEDWIDFERGGAEHRKGSTTLDEAISTLVKGNVK